MATPYRGGEVDLAAVRDLVDFHLRSGTNGICPVATTGESPVLSIEEKAEVIRTVVKMARGKMVIAPGTGTNSTAASVEMTRMAKELGADAALIVTPYYNKPTQEGLYQHFKTIAEAVPVDQILYNVPGRTACDMLNETVERLADIPNIIGIKDATGNIPRGAELVEAVKGRLVVYSGDDATAAGLMLAGAKGNVSVTANVAPKGMAALCEAAIAGNEEETERLNELLMPLNRKLFLEANPIPVKWALYHMGMIGEGIRLPLTPLSDRFHGEVEDALKASGVL